MNYWLMKSEPTVYSIDDLKRDRNTEWEGVRNYQARNHMRDTMKKGDLVLFYHSSTQPTGVAGLAKVSRAAAPDPTQFDKKSSYYDSTSQPAEPRWISVELSFMEKFQTFVPLDLIKNEPRLRGMEVTRRGSRLSVQPVAKTALERILELGGSRVKI
jgi:predicted RNA-binding protein with PUA-like domain